MPERFCFAVAGYMSLPERAELGAADCWFAVNSFERFGRTAVGPSVEWLAVEPLSVGMLSAERQAAETADIHLACRQLEIAAGPLWAQVMASALHCRLCCTPERLELKLMSLPLAGLWP